MNRFLDRSLVGGRGQDERMLDLMGYMDAPSLGKLAFVSHALYVFAHVEDLWKGLVVRVSPAVRSSARPSSPLSSSRPVMLQRVWSGASESGCTTQQNAASTAPLSERFLPECIFAGVKLEERRVVVVRRD